MASRDRFGAVSNRMLHHQNATLFFILILVFSLQRLWDVTTKLSELTLVRPRADVPANVYWETSESDNGHDDDHDAIASSVALPSTRSRINYTMHPKTSDSPFVYQNKFHRYYYCQPNSRQPLPDAMRHLLNYTTTVSTNLQILFMGDSVGLQFSQAFDEGVGASAETRALLRQYAKQMEGLTIAGPVRGGGLVASWRITGMLLRKGENRALPHAFGGGWTRSDVATLFGHALFQTASHTNATSTTADTTNRTTTINIGNATRNPTATTFTPREQRFDSMIFRIPHGWIPPNEITAETLSETVQLARELFGVSSIIFVSMPFVNNVLTWQDVKDLERANQELRKFANVYNANNSLFADIGNDEDRVKRVFVLEFGHLMDELMAMNARLMGYDASNKAYYTMDRMNNRWNNSIPFFCGQRPETTNTTSTPLPTACRQNLLTFDGIHWCMETIGGRVTAGIACLLACAHNNNHGTKLLLRQSSSWTTTDTDCERRCNNEFMSLAE